MGALNFEIRIQWISWQTLLLYIKENPTPIGPTNMPLLEALDFNCPVLCSDIERYREILEDAALYFYPLVLEEINKKWNWS